MVDSNVILKRIGKIRKCVAALETMRKTHSREQFLADETIQAAAERNIQVAIQAALDICNHVVADMKLEVPDEEQQAFRILAAHHVISGDLAKALAAMTGMRNVLVHEYLEIDHRQLYTAMTRDLGDFEKLINAILKLL